MDEQDRQTDRQTDPVTIFFKVAYQTCVFIFHIDADDFVHDILLEILLCILYKILEGEGREGERRGGEGRGGEGRGGGGEGRGGEGRGGEGRGGKTGKVRRGYGGRVSSRIFGLGEGKIACAKRADMPACLSLLTTGRVQCS